MYSKEEIFDYKQLIKKIVEKHPTSYFAILNQKNNKEILNFIINMTPLLTDDCYKLSTKLYWVLNDLSDFPQCPVCGKKYGINKNVNLTRGYSNTCGTTCGTLNVRQKIKQTCLQRYGVDNPNKTDYVRQKIKQTCLQKYGVQVSTKSETAKQQLKQTCLQKYGVASPILYEQFKKKIQRTKALKKYKKFQQNSKIVPMFDFDEFFKNKNNYHFRYKWKCLKCGNIFQDFINKNRIPIFGSFARCLICNPILQLTSKGEIELSDFIKFNYTKSILFNSRQIIKPYELDVYIPQKNIAIQFDGTYWHSDQNKTNDYHLMKTQMCKEKGIQLIHVFQDQWLYKQQIVKDRIKNVFGVYDNRIFARKCVIKEIKPSICNQFLDVNHIQGHDNSKIRLGLFYNDQLVSVMTFGKPRFNRNYEYELVRFASKLGTKVIGGASKLLKYFERNYQPKSLISYADRRYSNGKLYYALGFQFLNNSEPNYWWCKNNYKYTRYQCQKHKLKQLLGQDKFNPQLSESQNMYLNKYVL